MRSVLMSIQPDWCCLIASLKKLIEVRKTKPQLELPFKVYIYCTQASPYNPVIPMMYEKEGGNMFVGGKHYAQFLTGRVIGEFICDKIDVYGYDEHIGFPTPAYDGDPSFCDCGEGYWITCGELEQTCLTEEQMLEYGKKKTLYGWHISNLVMYEAPKELGNFFHVCDKPEGTDCSRCLDNREQKCTTIARPPQSWCYVEEVSA